jgi:hypothetical protein
LREAFVLGVDFLSFHEDVGFGFGLGCDFGFGFGFGLIFLDLF